MNRSELDLSDAAFREEPVTAAAEATEQPVDATEPVEEGVDTPDPDEDAEEAAEESDEDDDAEDEEEEESAEDQLLAGKYKDAAQLEKAYKELESLRGRERAALEQRIGQLEQYLQQQAQPQQGIDRDGLIAFAAEEPATAYQWIVQQVVQGGADPELVDDVLDEIADVDPKLERRLARHWDGLIQEAKQQQNLAPHNAQIAERRVFEATNQLIAEAPEAAQYAAEIAANYKQAEREGRVGLDPQSVYAAFREAYGKAVAADPDRLVRAREAARKAASRAKSRAQVEAGSPGSADAPKTEEDKVNESLFKPRSNPDAMSILFG